MKIIICFWIVLIHNYFVLFCGWVEELFLENPATLNRSQKKHIQSYIILPNRDWTIEFILTNFKQ